MVLRFCDSESASLAVAQLRDQGYFARVADTHTSSLWGPVTTDGVRVFVSEEQIADDCPTPNLDPSPGAVLRTLRVVTYALVLFGIGMVAFVLAKAAIFNPIGSVIALLCLVLLSTFALLMVVWSSMASKAIASRWRNTLDEGRFSIGPAILALVLLLTLTLTQQW